MHKILQNHLLGAFFANLKIDAKVFVTKILLLVFGKFSLLVTLGLFSLFYCTDHIRQGLI